jgi:hypothetical protein
MKSLFSGLYPELGLGEGFVVANGALNGWNMKDGSDADADDADGGVGVSAMMDQKKTSVLDPGELCMRLRRRDIIGRSIDLFFSFWSGAA